MGSLVKHATQTSNNQTKLTFHFCVQRVDHQGQRVSTPDRRYLTVLDKYEPQTLVFEVLIFVIERIEEKNLKNQFELLDLSRDFVACSSRPRFLSLLIEEFAKSYRENGQWAQNGEQDQTIGPNPKAKRYDEEQVEKEQRGHKEHVELQANGLC